MGWISAIGPADRSLSLGDRYTGDARPSLDPHAAADPRCRAILVALVAIGAEVTSLQQRCSHAPETSATVGAIQGRIDRLVDDLYGRGGDPNMEQQRRPR